jgi:hypothetical protein
MPNRLSLRVWLLAFTALAVLVVLTPRPASAGSEQPAAELRAARSLFVVGSDAKIPFDGRFEACAGEEVSVGLFRKGPAAPENPLFDGVAAATVVVGQDGTFSGGLDLPPRLESPATSWLGALGSCLSRPVFAQGAVLLGVLDPIGDPRGSSGIFIAGETLRSRVNVSGGQTLAESIGSVSVFANGQLCAIVSLKAAELAMGSGDVIIRLGSEGQPGACRTAGALISFARADGRPLFETRELVPGVTQPLGNMAPAPPSTGNGPNLTPFDPVGRGDEESGTGATQAHWVQPVQALLVCLGLAGVVVAGWTIKPRRR